MEMNDFSFEQLVISCLVAIRIPNNFYDYIYYTRQQNNLDLPIFIFWTWTLNYY